MQHGEDEAGITLVEIAVSLAILGLVLTAFFTVITGGLRSLSDSRARQDASQMATRSIESLRALSPPEIALFVVPATDPPFEIDPAAVSNCTASVDDDGDGTIDRTALGFDPDLPGGPLACEELVTNPQGAVTDQEPFNASVGSTTAVTTVPTYVTDVGGVQDGVVRVTVVVDYELQDGPKRVARQALFSEVNRG